MAPTVYPASQMHCKKCNSVFLRIGIPCDVNGNPVLGRMNKRPVLSLHASEFQGGVTIEAVKVPKAKKSASSTQMNVSEKPLEVKQTTSEDKTPATVTTHRKALVIGIGAYPWTSPLANPTNDSADMADKREDQVALQVEAGAVKLCLNALLGAATPPGDLRASALRSL